MIEVVSGVGQIEETCMLSSIFHACEERIIA